MEREICLSCNNPIPAKSDLVIRFGEDIEHWHPACLDRWLALAVVQPTLAPSYEMRRKALEYYRNKAEANGT